MHNGLSSCLKSGNTFGWLCKAYIPHLGDSSVSEGFFPREHVSIPHTSSMLQTYAPYRIPFMYLNHHELISTHYSNRPYYSRLNLDLWPCRESSWTLSWWTNIVWSPPLSQSNQYMTNPRLWFTELSKDGTYSPSCTDSNIVLKLTSVVKLWFNRQPLVTLTAISSITLGKGLWEFWLQNHDHHCAPKTHLTEDRVLLSWH